LKSGEYCLPAGNIHRFSKAYTDMGSKPLEDLCMPLKRGEYCLPAGVLMIQYSNTA